MSEELSSFLDSIGFDTSTEATIPFCQDFGRILQGQVSSILHPNSVEEVQQILELATAKELRVTVRGGGMSQSGQALGEGSMILLTDRLRELNVDSTLGIAQCGAGITWRELLDRAVARGWMPKVMPLNLDLTIGGTLSVGGVGSTSHNASAAIEYVEAITIVTGAGEKIVATEQHRSDVLAAVLGGAGRFGILCNATLRLRRTKPKVRTFYFLFDNLEANLLAQQKLTQRGCSHLEGFCTGAIQGAKRNARGKRIPFFEWFYGLHVGFEYETGEEPNEQEVLKDIHPYRFIHIEDDTVPGHAARYDFRFSAMRTNGTYEQLHPWFETLVPINEAMVLIPEILSNQPVWLGDGHRMTVFAQPRRITSFCTPTTSCLAFAILPMGVPETLREPTLDWIRWVDEQFRQVGSKRYISGWLPNTKLSGWKAHFGLRFEQWQNTKRLLDPSCRLTSLLFKEVDAEVFDDIIRIRRESRR